MSKDTVIFIGFVVGLVASVVALLREAHNLVQRFRRRRNAGGVTSSDAVAGAKARFHPVLSFFVGREVLVIVSAGVLINYLGLAVAVRLKSVLYLDMVGTAMSAFLLGPWWGAVTGLVSNSLVNPLLYPEPNADLIVFPWSLVNIAGGIFWGSMARRRFFREYLAEFEPSFAKHVLFLGVFGFLGAGVMGIVGTMIQAALAKETVLALDPQVAESIGRALGDLHLRLQPAMTAVLGEEWGQALSWGVPSWLQNWLRYIPDKTLSAAIGIVCIRYGFPLFEKELVHGGERSVYPRDTWLAPLTLGVLFAPSLAILISRDLYHADIYWPVWSLPVLAAVVGVILALYRGPTAAVAQTQRFDRLRSYATCLGDIQSGALYHFFRRLTYATLAASVLFVVCLPMLRIDFYRVAFNFFCVVYGFLLAMYLFRISICQNVAVARSEPGSDD